MLATVSSATLLGVEGRAVQVEVHVSSGIPAFTMVGLPDATCREARDRVRSALSSCEAGWPNRRITVNLAPSGFRKAGASLDLAVAIGVLVANGDLAAGAIARLAFLAELGLDGALRAVPGGLPLVDAIDADAVVVAPSLVPEARLVGRHVVRTAPDLGAVVRALLGEAPWPDPPPESPRTHAPRPKDLRDVRGQRVARTALEVAAAGGHHLLMLGPPGAGKTMLAERLPGILPPLDAAAALEVTRVHSAAGAPLPPGALVRDPPLRAPHHGASPVAMVGGGSSLVQPGEISLAHRGVLFLDEMGEFPVPVLDALRTPLEEGVVRVARAGSRVTFPARFLLVGAMNPCPCGGALTPSRCRCSDAALARYVRRLSGPLLDRFDLRIAVDPPDADALLGGAPGEPSEPVRARVIRARRRAEARCGRVNGALDAAALEACAPLDTAASAVLGGELRAGRLSPRGLRRVRAVALTIADLAGVDPPLSGEQVATALALRMEPSFLTRRLVSGL